MNNIIGPCDSILSSDNDRNLIFSDKKKSKIIFTTFIHGNKFSNDF